MSSLLTEETIPPFFQAELDFFVGVKRLFSLLLDKFTACLGVGMRYWLTMAVIRSRKSLCIVQLGSVFVECVLWSLYSCFQIS